MADGNLTGTAAARGAERVVAESWFAFGWAVRSDAERQVENSRFVDALLWGD